MGSFGQMTRRVRLVHWKEGEAAARVAQLRAAGFAVEYEMFDGPGLLRTLRERLPDAMVIDLTRMPSHGREVGMQVRRMKSLRSIPLVFVGGVAEKVEAIRARLPDATFGPWERVAALLEQALNTPLADPVVPEPLFDQYRKTPLSKKLGVKEGMRVALVSAPEGFEGTLGELPGGAVSKRGVRGRNDLLLWFVKSRAEVEARIVQMGAAAGDGGLWVIWPKQASGLAPDLTQQVVRDIGLGSGLVDFKVCSVDEIFTGLRFTRRK